MGATETPDLREDEARLRDTALRYARMMDRMSFDDLPTVLAEDGVLSGPGYEMTGHDQLRAGLQSLDQFEATLHGVLNTYFEIDGDHAVVEAVQRLDFGLAVDGDARDAQESQRDAPAGAGARARSGRACRGRIAGRPEKEIR